MGDYDEEQRSSKEKPLNGGVQDDAVISNSAEVVNASGHRDQLQRGYGLLSICGLALTVDNAWVAVGTSLSVAICKLHWRRPPNHLIRVLQTMEVLLVSFMNSSSPGCTMYSLLRPLPR